MTNDAVGRRPFCVLVAALGVVVLGLIFSPGSRTAAEPESIDKPSGQQKPELQPAEEIERLIRELSKPDARARERAYRELRKIGPAAVNAMRPELLGSKREGVPVALRLLADIQDDHGLQGVRANGLEFQPLVDLVWRLPQPGGATDVKIELKITNVGEKAVRFHLLNTVSFALSGPDGEVICGGFGRDHIRASSYLTPPLANGKSYTVSGFGAKLHRSADGKKVSLNGETEDGLFYAWPDLKPGRLFLCFGVSNKLAAPQPDGIPIWCGDARFPFIAIEIK